MLAKKIKLLLYTFEVRNKMNKVEANTTITNVKTAVVGGMAATLSHAIFLPPEAKAAVRNTMFGSDHFLETIRKATEENIKNTNKRFDMNLVIQNARKMYPEMEKTSKLVGTSLRKTFVAVTDGLFLVKSCKALYENIKANKTGK